MAPPARRLSVAAVGQNHMVLGCLDYSGVATEPLAALRAAIARAIVPQCESRGLFAGAAVGIHANCRCSPRGSHRDA
jgi:hypothetical protein